MAWWNNLIISVPGKLQQENWRSKASLSYITWPHLKKREWARKKNSISQAQWDMGCAPRPPISKLSGLIGQLLHTSLHTLTPPQTLFSAILRDPACQAVNLSFTLHLPDPSSLGFSRDTVLTNVCPLIFTIIEDSQLRVEHIKYNLWRETITYG